MLIGELAKLTGFTRDAIRFYEKEGLIKVNRKQRLANNYKDYSEETLKRLLSVKRLKGFGFTLNETADLIAHIDENMATCQMVSHKVADKVKVIDAKIEELKQIRNTLVNGVALCLNKSLPAESTNCGFLVPGQV